MSQTKPDVIMKDSQSTSGLSEESVIENSLRGRPTTVGLEKHNGKQTSGLEDHSPGSLTRQPASKSKEQLDQTNPVPLQTRPGPRSSQAKNDIPILKGSLVAAEQRLEEPLKETRINADTISQLENKLFQSNTSLEAAKTKFEESQARCKNLQIQIEAIGKDLKETREQVFRLQPHRENITQSDALREYIAICHSVKSWIGLRLDNALNAGSINVAKIHTGSARKLMSLLTPCGLNGTRYHDTDEYNLIAIVMEFLRATVFETDLYGAVDGQDLELIYQIQKNMKNLVPRRDQDLASRRSWRSETLDALAHSTDFDLRQRKQVEILSDELINVIGVIDNSLLTRECVKSLESKIIVPAIHLARQLHLSHSRYYVRFSGYSTSRPANEARGSHMLEEFDCIDVLANGKPVKLDDRSKVTPGGSIKYLLDVLPGFYCETFKADASEEKVLKKPQVLVTVAKPGKVQHQASNNHGEVSTILGSIHIRLQKDRAPCDN